MAKKYSNGVEVGTGFKLAGANPVDDREQVETFNDLLNELSIVSTDLRKWIEVIAHDTGIKYKWNGLDRTNADNWIESISAVKDFYLSLQFTNTLQPAKILAEFDFTIDSENHDSNVTDVRIGVNASPTSPTYPITVVSGDEINVEITSTITNQVSVVNLKCTKS